MLGHHRGPPEKRADDDPLLVLFGSSLPLIKTNQKRKKVSELDPLWQNFLEPRLYCNSV